MQHKQQQLFHQPVPTLPHDLLFKKKQKTYRSTLLLESVLCLNEWGKEAESKVSVTFKSHAHLNQNPGSGLKNQDKAGLHCGSRNSSNLAMISLNRRRCDSDVTFFSTFLGSSDSVLCTAQKAQKARRAFSPCASLPKQ